MKKQTLISIIIMLFFAGLIFQLFIVPHLGDKMPNVVSERDLVQAGIGMDGEKLFYWKDDKEENPLKYLALVAPFLTPLLYKFLDKKMEDRDD